MPAVPPTAGRKSLSDFKAARREHSLPAKAPQAHPELGLRDNPDARQFAKPTNPRSQQEGQAGQPQAQEQADPSAQDAAEQPSLAAPESESAEAPEQQEVQPGQLTDAEIVAKYREWEQSDLAPEEIFADKLHPVKVRGQERYVDYDELRSGYMRQADYTERGNELRKKESQVEGYRKSIDEHFATVKDPNQFLEIYERNGYGEVLEKVAESISQRRAEHKSLVVAAGRAMAERLGFTSDEIRAGKADNHRDVVAAMQRTDERMRQARAVEIENRKLAFEKERFESERQRATHEQEVTKYKQAYDRQISQLRPGAFKANGIQDNQGNRIAFLRHLGEVMRMEGGVGEQGITRTHVMNAARGMREEMEDRRMSESDASAPGMMSPQEARARAQADARRKALGPNRVATGAGRPIQTQGQQAKRASDFHRARQDKLLGR